MSTKPIHQPSPHPNALARLFAEAGQHLNRGDYAPAIEILERAHRLDPGNCKIVLDLGYANALAYDFAAAERWFEQGDPARTRKDRRAHGHRRSLVGRPAV